jgi:general secretion pathway protein D
MRAPKLLRIAIIGDFLHASRNGDVTDILVFLAKLRIVILLLAVSAGLAAADAHQLARDAARAARSGDYARAFLLYSQAAQLSPYSPYAALSRDMLSSAVRASQANLLPETSGGDGEGLDENLSDIISDEDLAEASKPLPPIKLNAKSERFDLRQRAPVRRLWEEVLQQYGLEVVFDESIRDAEPLPIHLDDVDYRTAIRALELSSNTVAYPVAENLVLVAPNSAETQTRLEPYAAVAIPLPYTLTTEEALEIANALRQALEIRAMMVDGVRRLMLVRDRYSRVLLAQLLAQELMNAPQDLVVEVLREVNRRSLYRYGINWMTTAPAIVFTTWMNNVLKPVEGVGYLAFGGNPMIGIGLSTVEAVAFMNRTDANTIYRAEARASSGKESTFKLGQRYPVVQQSYVRREGQQFRGAFFPQVQFEQLGFSMTVKPVVWRDSVTLDLKATIELLTGESVNGIPVFSNRETATRVRLDAGQTVAVAGLLSREEAVSLSGLAGLSQVPGIGALFRQTTTTKENTELLILITPRLIHQRPERGSTPTLYTGTATRFQAPL